MVYVDKQNPLSLCEMGGKMKGQGGFSDATLKVNDRDFSGHGSLYSGLTFCL